MKHIITTCLLFIVAFTININAQNKKIDELFNKYSGTNGFVTVNITADLFALFAEDKPESESQEFTDIIKGIQSLKVLSYNGEKNNKGTLKDFIKDIEKNINFNEYSKLMEVQDGPDKVLFLNKKLNGKMSEFIMYINSDKEATLVNIVGNLDLKQLSKISKEAGLKGLDKLDKLNK